MARPKNKPGTPYGLKVKIGSTQRAVLEALANHRRWSTAAGWVWDSQSNTRKILEALVKRGLVTKKEEPLNPIVEDGRRFETYRVVPNWKELI